MRGEGHQQRHSSLRSVLSGLTLPIRAHDPKVFHGYRPPIRFQVLPGHLHGAALGWAVQACVVVQGQGPNSLPGSAMGPAG